MPLVDVVVVAYNSRTELRRCVEPLLGLDWVNTIVVDNASPDRSGDAVADLPVTVVWETENLGFGSGCNAGWRRGSAPYVVFLNPDATIGPEPLRLLVEALEHDDRVGAVGPRIVQSDGSLDYSIRRFPQIRSTFAQALFVHRLSPGSPWADEVVRDVRRYAASGDAEWLSGACLMVRRAVLEKLNGFDTGFFMYCEDTDICRRIWDLGFSVRFVAGAEVAHEGGRSAPRSALLPVLAASRVRYARQHRTPLAAQAERFGVVLGELTHAAVGRGSGTTRGRHLAAAARALRS
jgi:N-acetylglucosaminyl-diphospho-decaprenol L-rhamnosyltransferase